MQRGTCAPVPSQMSSRARRPGYCSRCILLFLEKSAVARSCALPVLPLPLRLPALAGAWACPRPLQSTHLTGCKKFGCVIKAASSVPQPTVPSSLPTIVM